jgi:hypothetical protein
MGRPIKKKFFGTGGSNQGVGGEGIASVVVSGTFSGKTTSTAYTIPASVISAPTVPGGAKPTLSITFATSSTGAVTVVTPGSGYTATATISGAALQALGGGSGTVVLTSALTSGASARPNAIGGATAVAYLNSGTQGLRYDIIKQTGSHNFLVQNTEGQGHCKLVAAAPTAGANGSGQMTIIAQDANGSTYYVTKLTSRKAKLTQKTMSTAYVYATGDLARWTLDAAVGTDKTLSTTKVQVQSN